MARARKYGLLHKGIPLAPAGARRPRRFDECERHPRLALLAIALLNRAPGDAMRDLLAPRVARVLMPRAIEGFAIEGLRARGQMMTNRHGQFGVGGVGYVILLSRACAATVRRLTPCRNE